jgi:hypothetical protein
MKPEKNLFGRKGTNSKPFVDYFNQMRVEVIKKFFDDAHDDYTEDMCNALEEINSLEMQLSQVFTKINAQREKNFPEDM